MNRYLLAALYVMAGCAVTIPLKAQTNGEVLRGERCRLVITTTVKMVSACLEEDQQQSDFSVLPPDYFRYPFAENCGKDFSFDAAGVRKSVSLCRILHKIRAPERKKK